MKIIIAMSVCVLLTISALVFAHGGATGVVKERMDRMVNLKDAMKSLKPIYQGKKDYDVDIVKQNALIIRNNAGAHMTKYFPEGSLEMPSEALPEIWTEWETFQALSSELESLGQALYEAAENGLNINKINSPDEMKQLSKLGKDSKSSPSSSSLDHLASKSPASLIGMIRQNCSDCHKQYREQK